MRLNRFKRGAVGGFILLVALAVVVTGSLPLTLAAVANDDIELAFNLNAVPLVPAVTNLGIFDSQTPPIASNQPARFESEASTGLCDNLADDLSGYWFEFTPGADGSLFFSTNNAGTNFNTVISIWEAPAVWSSATDSMALLTEVTCVNDNPVDARAEITSQPLTGGTTYFIRVGGFLGAVGNAEITASFTASTGAVPTLLKEYDGAATSTIADDGVDTAVLTYTITNNDPNPVTAVGFDDLQFDANLNHTGLVNTCGGTVDTTTPGELHVSGITINGPAGTSCTISFNVTSTVPGVYPNLTSPVTSAFGLGNQGQAELTVTGFPTLTKTFAATSITPSGTTTLRFEIVNTNPTDATGLTFTDNFNAAPSSSTAGAPDLTVFTPSGITQGGSDPGCFLAFVGGDPAGDTTLTLDPAVSVVPAGATCFVEMTVTANDPGDYTNVVNSLTSNFGVNPTVTQDILQVLAQEPLFSAVYLPNPIGAGGTSTLTYTIDNSVNPTSQLDNISFSDTLSAGLAFVAGTPNVVVSSPNAGQIAGCQAALSLNPFNPVPVGGATTLNVVAGDGFDVPAGFVCTISVNVTSNTVGSYPNSAPLLNYFVGGTPFTTTVGTGDADATLNVVAAADPLFEKEVSGQNPIPTGGTSAYTFRITNPNTTPLTRLRFTDGLPAQLNFGAVLFNDCTNGTGAVTPAGNSLSVTAPAAGDNTLAGGAFCEIIVEVIDIGTVVVPTTYDNITNVLQFDQNPASTVTAATDPDLVVGAEALLAKAFVPNTIVPSGISTLTYQITNTNDVALTGVSFDDDLANLVSAPPGDDLVIATPLNVNFSAGCGAATATDFSNVPVAAGGTQLRFTFNVAAATSPITPGVCDITVDVTATIPGTYENATSQMTGTTGPNGVGEGTLLVSATPSISITQSGGTTAVIENTPVVAGVDDDTFTVVLTSPPTGNVDITMTFGAEITVNGSASPVVLTFTNLNWFTPQLVTVEAVDDLIVETTPHFDNIAFTATSTDTTYDSAGTANFVLDAAPMGATTDFDVSITDNDFGSVEFQSLTSATIDESAVNHTVTLVLTTTAPLTSALSVDVVDLGTGSAGGAGLDYTYASPTTVTFPIGSINGTTLTVDILVVQDTLVEGDETVNLELQNVANGSLGVQITHTATITDDDNLEISIDDVATLEGDTNGTVFLVFTISIQQANPFVTNITVDFTTNDNTAFDPSDYLTTAGTAIIGTGATSTTVSVPVTSDTLTEVPITEDFTVTLSNPTPSVAVILDGTGVGTITDDDDVEVSISDANTLEGDTPGTVFLVFTVSLSQPNPFLGDITVDFTTTDNTAFAASDYTTTAGTAIIGTGATSTTISVPVTSDTFVESPVTEDFTVTLTNPTPAGVTLFDDIGIGTIDDDDEVGISIDDQIVVEGNTPGTVNLVFNITLSQANPYASNITVDFATLDVTASSVLGSDFTATAGTAIIATGATGTTVTVPVTSDLVSETPITETFEVNLTNPSVGSTLVDAQGIGTITDDDQAAIVIITPVDPAPTEITIAEPSTTNTYTVVLGTQPAPGSTVTILLAVSDPAEATAPISVVFTDLNWDTPQIVTVAPIDDAIIEGVEQVTITHTVDTSVIGRDPVYDTAPITVDLVATNIVTVNINDDDIPVQVVKSFDPDRIVGGAPSTMIFEFTNTNLLPVTVTNFTDVLTNITMTGTAPIAPLVNTCGFTFATADSDGFDGGTAVIGNGVTCTVEFDVTSVTPGDNPNVATFDVPGGSNLPTNTALLTVGGGASMRKEFTPGPHPVGGTFELIIYVSTPAGAPLLTGLGFTDNLQDNLEIIGAPTFTNCGSFPAGSADATKNILTVSNVDLASGATCEVRVRLTTSVPGTYRNEPANISNFTSNETGPIAPGFPPAIVDVGGSAGGGGAAPAAAAPDRRVTDSCGFIRKSVDRSLANIGNTLTYTITFTNPRSVPLTNVVISDQFDARLTGIRVVSNSIGTPNVAGNLVNLTGFQLQPGQSGTLVITAVISNSARAGDVIRNTASLESPDASIHFCTAVETAISPTVLPGTGEAPLNRWRLPIALLTAVTLAMLAYVFVKYSALLRRSAR